MCRGRRRLVYASRSLCWTLPRRSRLGNLADRRSLRSWHGDQRRWWGSDHEGSHHAQPTQQGHRGHGLSWRGNRRTGGACLRSDGAIDGGRIDVDLTQALTAARLPCRSSATQPTTNCQRLSPTCGLSSYTLSYISTAASGKSPANTRQHPRTIAFEAARSEPHH